MTTLILDRRNTTLYADKREVYEKTGIKQVCNKIFPISFGGKHWGWCATGGDSDHTELFIRVLGKLPELHAITGNEELDKIKKLNIDLILVSTKGDAYVVGDSLIPRLITEPYTASGSGWVAAVTLLDAGHSVPEIFKLINQRQVHTSRDYDQVNYGQKNAKITYHPNEG